MIVVDVFFSLQLLFSPSCFFLFVSASAFHNPFLKCLITLTLSLCSERACRKLCACKCSLLTVIGDHQGDLTGSLPWEPTDVSLFRAVLLQSLAWRSMCKLLPVFWGESLKSQHLVCCQYGTLPLCSPSQKSLFCPLRYKPLGFSWVGWDSPPAI